MDMDMPSGVRGPDRAPSEPRVTIFTLHSVSYLDDPWIQRTRRISGSRTPGGETAGYPAGHVLMPRCPRGSERKYQLQSLVALVDATLPVGINGLSPVRNGPNRVECNQIQSNTIDIYLINIYLLDLIRKLSKQN